MEYPEIPYLQNTFLLHLHLSWNRLVPVAIAAFRYIMVCHAVFVQNHGGEKQVVPYAICLWDVIYLLIYLSKVWRLLISFLSTLSLALGISIMFNTELNHTYLVCVGREEVFRSTSSFYFILSSSSDMS